MSLMDAIVVDTKDPEQRGRVRLSIPGLFYDPEKNVVLDSPWCDPKGGGGRGVGSLDVPEVGSRVLVQAVHLGSTYQLIYERGPHGADDNGSYAPPTGRGVDDESVQLKVSAPFRVPSPTTALEKKLPSGSVRRSASLPGVDSTGATVAPDAAGERPGELRLQIPTSANAGEYPRNKVTKTAGGFVVEMDDTPGSERYQIHHPSGASMEIGAGGTWTKRAAKRFEETLEHVTSRVGGDVRRRVDGHVLESDGGNRVEDTRGRRVILASELNARAKFDLLMEAGAEMALAAKTSMRLKALGDMKVQSGGRASFTSAGDMSLTAALGNISAFGMQGVSISSFFQVGIAAGARATVRALGAVDILAGADASMTAVGVASMAAGGRATVAGGGGIGAATGAGTMNVTPTGLPLTGTPVALATPLVTFLDVLVTQMAALEVPYADGTPMWQAIAAAAQAAVLLTPAPLLWTTSTVGI